MDKRDNFQTITDAILERLEKATTMWEIPWVGMNKLPTNVLTKREYTGLNAMWLHLTGQTTWGTYKQWKKIGAQVRKGEKSNFVLVPMKGEKETSDGEKEEFLWFRGAAVFHGGQVDGWEPEDRPNAVVDTVAIADEIVAASGVTVRESPGAQASYNTSSDVVTIAERRDFVGTANSTPTEAYYGTLMHELVHATGHESRLKRDLTGRFGSESYAMEEMIAEIGSAFLAAETGLSIEPREDNIAYLQSWIKVLKEDKRAVMTAASKARQAAQFLTKSVKEVEVPNAA